MKSASMRELMLAIAKCDAATDDQRTRAAYLARRFDPTFSPDDAVSRMRDIFGI